jgi:hypothetical protein
MRARARVCVGGGVHVTERPGPRSDYLSLRVGPGVQLDVEPGAAPGDPGLEEEVLHLLDRGRGRGRFRERERE